MNTADYPDWITARQIDHQYDQTPVLNQVSLSIRQADYLTLIGLNGAGKSTLLRILLGLIPPSRGQVSHHPDLRIGYVPQRWQPDAILPMRVRELLSLTRPQASNDEIHQHLQRFDCQSLINQHIHTLSGGQWQRVLLARAMLNHPTLLALDEPTQGLDLKAQHDLYQQLTSLHEQGTSILLVSHDLAHALAYSHRIIGIAGGICCQGTPEQIQQDPAYLQRFVCAHRAPFGQPGCTHHA